MGEVVLKFVVSLLLGRKKQYFKVVRVKERNVLITIEEYIPANELLKKVNRANIVSQSHSLELDRVTGLYSAKTEHS